jgi:hypothetical protein
LQEGNQRQPLFKCCVLREQQSFIARPSIPKRLKAFWLAAG